MFNHAKLGAQGIRQKLFSVTRTAFSLAQWCCGECPKATKEGCTRQFSERIPSKNARASAAARVRLTVLNITNTTLTCGPLVLRDGLGGTRLRRADDGVDRRLTSRLQARRVEALLRSAGTHSRRGAAP